MKGVAVAQILLTVSFPLAIFLFSQAQAFALPQGQTVEAGDASFQYSADNTTLNVTAADKTVINFQSFNIALGEAVNFLQPSSSASVLARVLGGGPSLIAGSLSANGNLFLTNPAGINKLRIRRCLRNLQSLPYPPRLLEQGGDGER